jgi:hypothetical protein
MSKIIDIYSMSISSLRPQQWNYNLRVFIFELDSIETLSLADIIFNTVAIVILFDSSSSISNR